MEEYLCDPQDFRKLPRQYLINLINTVIGEPFSAWVSEKVEVRNRKLIEESNSAITLDPEILRAFNDATSISSKSCTNFTLYSVCKFLSSVYLSLERQRGLPPQVEREAQEEER